MNKTIEELKKEKREDAKNAYLYISKNNEKLFIYALNYKSKNEIINENFIGSIKIKKISNKKAKELPNIKLTKKEDLKNGDKIYVSKFTPYGY